LRGHLIFEDFSNRIARRVATENLVRDDGVQ